MAGKLLAANLEQLQARILSACQRAGRDSASLKLIAVSKLQTPEAVSLAAALGITDFGENYVQELLNKIQSINNTNLRWHMIGHLQTNKAKQVVGRCELIHSVDSERLLLELDRRAGELGVVQKILLQIKINDELSKSGVSPEQALDLTRRAVACSHLCCLGFMTIPDPAEPSEIRRIFRRLGALRDAIASELQERDKNKHSLFELSMGMTQDFEIAIEEGATMVRVGSAIFGPRPQTER